MRLLLLRHAKSENAGPGGSDHDRALVARGREDAPTIGAYIDHHALRPDQVIVSDARRTRETWESLATALSAPPPVSYVAALYNAGARTIMDTIKESPPATRTLLVIGHNPGLQDVAQILIASGDVAARERLNEGLPTSGLLVIDFVGDDWRQLHPQSGRLEHFITPRSLRSVAD